MRALPACWAPIASAISCCTACSRPAWIPPTSYALDARGERSFAFYRPPSADLLFRIEHFRPQTFNDTAVFHICSNSMTDTDLADVTLTGMRRARQAG